MDLFSLNKQTILTHGCREKFNHFTLYCNSPNDRGFKSIMTTCAHKHCVYKYGVLWSTILYNRHICHYKPISYVL